jgi:hypothetical protein
MAVQQTQALPPQYVEDLQKDYGTQLTATTAAPLNTGLFAPKVAGQDAAQTQAYNLATGQGIGAFQDYLTQAGDYDTGAAGFQTGAQQYGTQAAGALGTAGTSLANAGIYGTQAAGALGGAGAYGTAAGGFSGPSAYSQFMSPYQQDVIDATLSEYDTQAASGMQGIADRATMAGNLGGGREGVMRSQYQNKSDMNRALLQSGLLQQGFTQANQLANQAFGQQRSLADLQRGISEGQRNLGQLELGTADRELNVGNQLMNLGTQQMNLGDQQLNLSRNQQALASLAPSLYGQDINTLRSAGAGQQAQEQAQLDAIREANRLEAYEPYERLGYLGSGIASIASGAPGQYQSMVTPNPTPLQNALGIASVAGGLMSGYGDMMGTSG